jgi:hypothetical protein
MERVGNLVCIWTTATPDKDNGHRSQSCSETVPQTTDLI